MLTQRQSTRSRTTNDTNDTHTRKVNGNGNTSTNSSSSPRSLPPYQKIHRTRKRSSSRRSFLIFFIILVVASTLLGILFSSSNRKSSLPRVASSPNVYDVMTDSCIQYSNNGSKCIPKLNLCSAQVDVNVNVNPIDTDTDNTSTGTDTGSDDTSKLTDINNNIITDNPDRGFAINFPENFKQKLMSLQISGSARAGSGCSLSRKYGFFYIHNLKVGGTTTKKFLEKALCPIRVEDGNVDVDAKNDNKLSEDSIDGGNNSNKKINGEDRRQKRLNEVSRRSVSEEIAEHRRKEVHRLNGVKVKRKIKRKNNVFECSAGNEIYEVVDCNLGLNIAIRESYFIWSFVRNPFSRLYSGFAMAEDMANRTDTRDRFKPFTFREFAMADQHGRHQLSPTSNSHYEPQYKFLTDKNKCPVFDYVGRLEYYEEDLLRIVNEIEKRYNENNSETSSSSTASTPLLKHYQESIGIKGQMKAFDGTSFGAKREAKQGKGGGMNSVYSDPIVVEKVYKEYKTDFDLFGYSASYPSS